MSTRPLAYQYSAFKRYYSNQHFSQFYLQDRMPSVLCRCWLGGRKGIRPVKTEWWGTGVVICLERGADLHMAQLMPVPLTVSCSSKIQIGFTFLIPAYPGSPGKEAVKWLCVVLFHQMKLTLTCIWFCIAWYWVC